MKQNPLVYKYPGEEKYAIRYVRNNWTVLLWVQDLFSRKMKTNVNRPVVLFDTKEEAESEVLNVVIPYLIAEKGIDKEEIVGW
jgi:hypothetical protein